MCHAPFPKLTAIGEAIRLNGYKMPEGDELYIKDEPVSMGAEAYKRVFPKAVWPSHIPSLPPISLRLIGDFELDIGDAASARDSNLRTEFPHELEIFSFGAFGDNMSFYAELEFEHFTSVTGVGGGEYEGAEEINYEAWLMWEDLFVENVFNIKVGSIGGNEIALPNARDHSRNLKNHYLYRDKITKGLDGPGLEINGFAKNWRYAAGAVKPEQNKFVRTDYYIQGSLKFGGIGYDGSGGLSEEGGLKEDPAGYWRDDSILIGGFYHIDADDIDRFGLDSRLNYKDLSVAIGWATKNDDVTDMEDDVWFVDSNYFLYPWLIPYIVYETYTPEAANGDQSRILLGISVLARANIKLNLEGRFYTENEPREAAGLDKNLDDRIFLRVDFAW
jgi:hypothetical protein